MVRRSLQIWADAESCAQFVLFLEYKANWIRLQTFLSEKPILFFITSGLVCPLTTAPPIRAAKSASLEWPAFLTTEAFSLDMAFFLCLGDSIWPKARVVGWIICTSFCCSILVL